MILSMKLMGKRQIGEMQMSELVTAFFLSELATYTVTDSRIPLLYGIIPILLMICIEVIVSFFAIKNPLMKQIFDFTPSILIRNGEILQQELLKNRLTLDELFSLLRLNGYYDLKKVNFAMLEPNGQLSVIPFAREEAVAKGEIGIQSKDNGFSVAVINDGVINSRALNAIGKSERWVRDILKKNKIQNEKDVFLLSSDFLGDVILISKDKKS